MARYVIEAMITEVDENGDEVQIVAIQSPTLALDDKDLLLWVGKRWIDGLDVAMQKHSGATPYYPPAKN
jgi:hypothetical protein